MKFSGMAVLLGRRPVVVILLAYILLAQTAWTSTDYEFGGSASHLTTTPQRDDETFKVMPPGALPWSSPLVSSKHRASSSPSSSDNVGPWYGFNNISIITSNNTDIDSNNNIDI
jgi:hypothetical protein